MPEGDPDLSHISRSDYAHIYEPAEDSFLLMDALKADLPFLNSRLSLAPICLEIGSGSGFVSAYASSLLPSSFWFATDINPRAIEITQQTYKQNKVRGDVILTNLTNGLNIPKGIEMAFFNPPYVPTPSSELQGTCLIYIYVSMYFMHSCSIKLYNNPFYNSYSLGNGINRAWAGGERGREILDLLFPLLPHVLSKRGIFYTVLLPANDPEEIIEIMKPWGFRAKKILERSTPLERGLHVLRFSRGETEREIEKDTQESAEPQEDNKSTSIGMIHSSTSVRQGGFEPDEDEEESEDEDLDESDEDDTDRIVLF